MKIYDFSHLLRAGVLCVRVVFFFLSNYLNTMWRGVERFWPGWRVAKGGRFELLINCKKICRLVFAVIDQILDWSQLFIQCRAVEADEMFPVGWSRATPGITLCYPGMVFTTLTYPAIVSSELLLAPISIQPQSFRDSKWKKNKCYRIFDDRFQLEYISINYM